jgi:lambda family phage portal protein
MLKRFVEVLKTVGGQRSNLGYDAAKVDRSNPYNPQALSIVAETLNTLPRLRAKSRDLIQNDELAASAALKLTNGVVGWGIHPQASSQSDDFNELVDRQWEMWSRLCSPSGIDVYGVQCQSVLGMFASGEAFIVRVTPPKDAGMKVPLWLRLYEADMVDQDLNMTMPNGNRVVQGVEFDKWDRPVTYYFHPTHPGDAMMSAIGGGNENHIKVAASDVVHLFEKPMARPSQVRGVPRLAPVINAIRNLSDYQTSELIKQKVAACFGLVFSGAEGEESTKLCDASGRPITSVFPGMIGYGAKDMTVTTVQPPSVVGYWDYVRGHQHSLAAGIGVPYARLTGDLSQVNFSSSRIGEGYYARENDAVQWLTVIPLLCERIWRWFISAAFDAGILTVPVVPVTWATQRFPSVNPAQDAQARRASLRDGVTTLSAVIAEQGDNPRQVMKKRAAENDMLDKLGLVFDSDPRQRTLAGVEQPVYDHSGDANAPVKP